MLRTEGSPSAAGWDGSSHVLVEFLCRQSCPRRPSGRVRPNLGSCMRAQEHGLRTDVLHPYISSPFTAGARRVTPSEKLQVSSQLPHREVSEGSKELQIRCRHLDCL